jgi:hypothetical protein
VTTFFVLFLFPVLEIIGNKIFTGLIIDAFGELRDQLEQVKESLEVMFIVASL